MSSRPGFPADLATLLLWPLALTAMALLSSGVFTLFNRLYTHPRQTQSVTAPGATLSPR